LRYHVQGNLATEKNAICVDDVVRLMFCVQEKGVPGKTYHCTHPKPIAIRDLHDITTKHRSIGYICMTPDFNGEEDPKQEFIHRAVRVYQSYMLRNDPVFDQQHALTLDGWHPVVLAGPRLETMLHRYLDGLRRQEEVAVGFLDTSLDLGRLSDVQKYGDFSLAHDTMSRQVNAFRVEGLPGYIAYAAVKNTAIMVGDPVSGEPSRLLDAFLTFCREHVLSFCGLQLRRNTALALQGTGLAVNKMGIETSVDLSAFDMGLKGEEYRPIRKYRNTAKRHGIAFVERPVDLINPHEVLRVSDSWISRKKNRLELRLLLRPLSPIPEPGVRHCFIREDGRILGFVFFTPIYREERIISYTAGIERYDIEGTGLPGNFNVMRYIACEFARTVRKEGIERIALGTSPLYDVENSDLNDNPALVRLMRRVYDESELYAFRGIAQHKKGYPCRIEEPVYIATERDATEESVLDVFKGVGFLDA